MNTSVRSSAPSKRGLILTVGVFFLPFLAALVLHLTGWYQAMGTTNRGTLISPPLDTSALSLKDALTGNPAEYAGRWHMLYVLPSVCDAACKNTLTLMHQVRSALGPESDRVTLLVVSEGSVEGKPELPKDAISLVGEGTVAKLDAAVLKAMGTPAPDVPRDRLYLVDTMGMVFMHYRTYNDEHESILKGREVLKDLQHVLKLSKIG